MNHERSALISRPDRIAHPDRAGMPGSASAVALLGGGQDRMFCTDSYVQTVLSCILYVLYIPYGTFNCTSITVQDRAAWHY
jgi:hypothetical protein